MFAERVDLKQFTGKLPGLNGLRAIAASFVLVGHVYQISGFLGNQVAAQLFERHDIGKEMVNLFFVISGFIITYILLREQKQTGSICLSRFYRKRLFRIWPLYFFLFFIVYILNQTSTIYAPFQGGVFIGPLNGKSILLFGLFLVNTDFILQIPVSVLPHYWSLSVEEQFYLIWPPLFKKVDPMKIALVVLFGTIGLKVVSDYLTTHGGNRILWGNVFYFFHYSCFGSIAVGAIAAIAVTRFLARLRFVFHPVTQVLSWVAFGCIILFRKQMPYIPFIQNELFGVLYVILILNVALNKKPIITLENRFFDRIGTVSYGLYLYHWPLIPLLIGILKWSGLWSLFCSYYLLPFVALTFIVTFVIASLSYDYFEKPFIDLKYKFRNDYSQITTLESRTV